MSSWGCSVAKQAKSGNFIGQRFWSYSVGVLMGGIVFDWFWMFEDRGSGGLDVLTVGLNVSA